MHDKQLYVLNGKKVSCFFICLHAVYKCFFRITYIYVNVMPAKVN